MSGNPVGFALCHGCGVPSRQRHLHTLTLRLLHEHKGWCHLLAVAGDADCGGLRPLGCPQDILAHTAHDLKEVPVRRGGKAEGTHIVLNVYAQPTEVSSKRSSAKSPESPVVCSWVFIEMLVLTVGTP